MSLVVLDASVATKWFLPAKSEPLAPEAFGLLSRFASGEVAFVVPDLFWAELGNVLWKAIRQARCRKATAEAGLLSLKNRGLTTVPCFTLLDLAFDIAVAFERSVYDCLYVALAVTSNAQLVTADERLANTFAAHFPVRWLGAPSAI